MFEKGLKSIATVGRSKAFLLFVILLLTGYIYLHFNTAGHQLAVSNKTHGALNFHVNTVAKLLQPNSSIQNKLIENNNQILFNDTLEVVTNDYTDIRLGRTCKKKMNVSFLKVHKAGSTTIMNIFLRFAISNQLNIVLPPKSNGFGFNYLGYGKTVSRDRIVPIPKNESYNILCNHVVYNKTAFRSIMPEDTVYVAILREPKTHFVSAASYYGFYSHLKAYARQHNFSSETSVMSEFLKNKSLFNVGTYFVYNRMSFDFGIPKSLFHDVFVDSYIEELSRDYGLVMMMEKFPESLVLLKRLLCWDTKDILYVPLNARNRGSPEFTLTEEDITLLKHWNSADFKLYDHFRRTFDEKLKAGGRDLIEEVESFKKTQETVKEFCNSKKPVGSSCLTIPKTKWDSSFNVSQRDCDLMTESELPMMRRLINGAWDKFRKSQPEVGSGRLIENIVENPDE